MITYNHGEFLEEAIESVLSQEFSKDYEIIIGEDNSPDNSKEILKNYEEKYPQIIKVIYRDKNIGAINNFYDVFLKATGEYIVYLEGDDYWTDNKKLEKQVEFLENNKDFFGCFHIVDDIENGKFLRTYPTKELLESHKVDEIYNPGQLLKLIREANFIGNVHINSLMFRNEINFNDNKIRNFICDAKMIADFQFEIVLLTHGKLKLIRESMSVHRRVTKKNWTSFSSQKLKFIYDDYSHILDNMKSFLDYKYKDECKKIIDKYNRTTIINCVNNKEYNLAKTIFMKLNIVSKFHVSSQLIKYVIANRE
jgi:glycosyltransferase involved in cell wall biosynthesis